VGELAAPVAATGANRDGPAAELFAAIAFLTRIPIGARAASRSRTGAAAFGLVGALLGVVAGLPLLALGAAHPVPAAVAAVGLLAALSGALHLDGLADTVDALAAPAGSEEQARTDPRAGTAGVVAIAVVLGLDAAALAELAGRGGGLLAMATLVAAAAVSRAVAPAWAVGVGWRRHPQGGLGTWFADATTGAAAVVALVSAAIVLAALVEFAGPRVALAAIIGAIAGSAIGAGLIRLRRQLDGDGYGALIEVTAAAILLSAALLG
jgi:adenosylcobinamide-GDP ribazoletransferase